MPALANRMVTVVRSRCRPLRRGWDRHRGQVEGRLSLDH